MRFDRRIIAVRRADRFSPNSVENDRAILQAVIDRLGSDIPMIDEEQLMPETTADFFVSMGRLPRTTALLRRQEKRGAVVVNSGVGVENCVRSKLDALMRRENYPMPPLESGSGYWLKRGDAAAQSKDDVVFCRDKSALEAARKIFAARGVTDIVISSNVEGDLIKFYAVSGGFFRYYYPSDDGQFKFADERLNEPAHHYAFDVGKLQKTVTKLADRIGIDVYGGDAIIDVRGQMYIIDFNDWPSFSRCRDAAAEAIVSYLKTK